MNGLRFNLGIFLPSFLPSFPPSCFNPRNRNAEQKSQNWGGKKSPKKWDPLMKLMNSRSPPTLVHIGDLRIQISYHWDSQIMYQSKTKISHFYIHRTQGSNGCNLQKMFPATIPRWFSCREFISRTIVWLVTNFQPLSLGDVNSPSQIGHQQNWFCSSKLSYPCQFSSEYVKWGRMSSINST